MALLRQVLTFGVVGALGVAVNAGSYAGLVLMGFAYPIAAVAAWLLSFFVGYTFNKRWTFRSDASARRALPRVFLVYIAQLALLVGAIAAMVEIMGLGPLVAYAVVAPFSIAFSFFSLKYFAFRET